MYQTVRSNRVRISRIHRDSNPRKRTATKADAEGVKRRSKERRKKIKRRRDARGPVVLRAAREEVRVVKRVLLARRGRFLLAFLDGGPSAIFRVKHRDASTSVRSLARCKCKKNPSSTRFPVSRARSAATTTFCANVGIGFSRVSLAARNLSARFANAIVGDRLSTSNRRVAISV